jgi:proteasome lid subunit RPN8/RPN11
MKMGMVPEVTSAVLEAIQAEAARAGPYECCGLLLGYEADGACRIERALPAVNVAERPERQFEIDPRALIAAHRSAREGGARIVGYYHSHPAGAAEPSATDRALAAHDGKVWAIIAGEEVSFWRDAANRFEPLSYRLVHR